MELLTFALALGSALALGITVFILRILIRSYGLSKFVTRAGNALSDLGMQATMLPSDLSKAFLDECYAERKAKGRKSDARALALDLFLKYFMAYSAPMTPYQRLALIEHSIRTARQWQKTDSLEETSDNFVDTIKEIFIDEMLALPKPPADKPEMVSRVMSL